MSNLIVRSITGLVFVSLLIGSVFIHPLGFPIVISFFAILGIIEYLKLFKNHTTVHINWQIHLFFALLFYGTLFSMLIGVMPLIGIVFLLPIVFLLAMTELYAKKDQPLANIAISIFGWIYILLPFLLMILIEKNGNYTETKSFPLIVGMFLLIWSNDTFAYLTGRIAGKNKLFERISPKKTWEGTIGGIVFTFISAYLISYFTEANDTLFWIVSAAIIAPTAIFGDLLESLFKRSLNIKDSGTILPGHGGILDRFDAAFMTAPFFLVWVYIYLYF